MVLSRWDPWAELAAMQRDVQELFGRTAGGARRPSSLVPAMDAYRTDDATVLHLEVPGFSPEEIDINYQRGVLTISGERRADQKVGDEQWLRRERSVGRFTRSVSLAEEIDPSGISANFENGVLEVRIPHAPEEQPTRIPVQGAASEPRTLDVGGEAPSAG